VPSPIGGMRGEQLQFAIVGPELDNVASLSRELARRLGQDPDLGRIDLDLQLDLPQLRLEVDRVRAADVGLTSADVAFAVNMLAGGVDIAKYNDDPGDGDRYDIRVKAADGEIVLGRRPAAHLPAHAHGQMVRLDTVATARTSSGPAVINRFGLQYSANFYSNPTMPLGAAVERVRARPPELLPPGYSMELQARAREFAKTSGYVRLALMLALALVYMVLASQFNSFLQPLIVMTGAAARGRRRRRRAVADRHTLNMISMIGLVLLMGLVAKNSILLVDLTNQLREQGRGVDEALREACPIRLRPVLMTSLTLILALLPAASASAPAPTPTGRSRSR
jgi:hydrophobic/amphiphilic exporter-1 (mainly G- bacteria), HAE1 family